MRRTWLSYRKYENMNLSIQPVQTIEECRAVEAITQAAWGGGYEISVPEHLTITLAREEGSLVLLARDGEKPVGFCMGFLAFRGEGKRLKHYSHQAAVLPDYRGKQVGEQIKWAQREAVLAMGIDLITWTYDPLETLNGRLNLHKLGAVCRHYKRDVYGDVYDALNEGLPTDRFYVEWWLQSTWVQAHVRRQPQGHRAAKSLAAAVPVANPPRLEAGLWHVGDVVDEALARKQVFVAVPKQFQHIKRQQPSLAVAWRQQTRYLFEKLFAQEYVAVDLLVDETLCYYLLEKAFDRSGTWL